MSGWLSLTRHGGERLPDSEQLAAVERRERLARLYPTAAEVAATKPA